MKYSAVFAVALAASAAARAVPGGDDKSASKPYDGPGGSAYPDHSGKKDDSYKSKGGDDSYKSKGGDNSYGSKDNKDSYGSKDNKDSYGSKDNKDSYGKKDTSYSPPKKDSYTDSKTGGYYDSDKKDDDKWKYAACPQQSYEDKRSKPDYKPYFPAPPPEKSSCYKDLQWAPNVSAGKPCEIKWQGSHGGDWKDDDDSEIHVYKCKDGYEKPHKVICDKDCGKGSYTWNVEDDFEPSNCDQGSTYRFKFVNKKDNSKYTWGCEIPIWNQGYFDKNKDSKSSMDKCPPPQVPPPCPTCGSAPGYPQGSEKEASQPTGSYPSGGETPSAPSAPSGGESPSAPSGGESSPSSPAGGASPSYGSPSTPAGGETPSTPAGGESPSSPAGGSPSSPSGGESPSSPAGGSPSSPSGGESPSSPAGGSPASGSSPSGEAAPACPGGAAMGSYGCPSPSAANGTANGTAPGTMVPSAAGTYTASFSLVAGLAAIIAFTL